ncbi:hypothetical protein OF83DRAFT_935047 [Amylostereum chailletii]|nr:hypothetical protein OF83DRAFT_935047 [Amylostereum chailletii]
MSNSDTQNAVPSSLTTHGHILSNWSRKKSFDTFIFCPTTPHAMLVGAINSTLHDPSESITVKQVQGWLRMLYPGSFKSRDFAIHPAEVTQFASGRCAVTAKDDSEPVASEKALLPGTYCCVSSETRVPFTDLRNADQCRTFTGLRAYALKNRKRYEENLSADIMTDRLQSDVRTRDAYACFLTRLGAGGDLDPPVNVHWIFPPSCMGELRKIHLEFKDMAVLDNAAVMSEGVAKLMHDNAIGIDVDDGFRIVAFEPLPPKWKEQHHIPESASFLDQNGPTFVMFLRWHFLWCLALHFQGNDIEREITPSQARDLRGIIEKYGADSEEVGYMKEEPQWQTPAGLEIMELMLATYVKRTDSDDDLD